MASTPDPAGLLAGLDPAQREAVTSDASLLAILAGAGSGKTRVLTRRIAHRVATGSADPRHVLALTFTRRAAGELTARLGALGLRHGCAAGTFHAIAQAQLQRWWADRGQPARQLVDRREPVLAPLVAERARGRPGPGVVAEVAAEATWAKARGIAPAGYVDAAATAGRRTSLPPAVVAELLERYDEAKRRRRVVDFDDLLLLCTEALERDPAFAAAQRWRFRHLFVDEFQDVNPLQLRLVRAWRGTGGDLCAVGDPLQAIYGWNGADPTVLPRFTDHFPGATVVRLRDSYRSAPQVLQVAAAVARAGAGGGDDVELVAHRSDGPVPGVHRFTDEQAEARGVARLVRDRRGGRSWGSVAVLARTNAQAAALTAALAEARIPHRTRGATVLDDAEVRGWLRQVSRLATPAQLSAALSDLDDDDPGEALVALAVLGRTFVRLDPSAGGSAFAAWLRSAVAGDAERGDDGVDVATFHAAKGLEWDLVVVAGVEEGLVPMSHPTAAARAEEVRLLYVAVTRARQELHLTWAASRVVRGVTTVRRPSPLLDPIQAVVAQLAAQDRPGDRQAHLAEVRRAVSTAAVEVEPGPAQALRAALVAWRATAARAAGVDPRVVLDDAALAAVAQARPRDPQALAALAPVGPVKARAWGPAVLALVAEHGSAEGAADPV